MAQIKKIVKPGDLIRGAKVGVAGLDKDGQIVAFTASPEDAGKVLTVGEDGSIILAKASGGDIPVRKITVTPDTVTEITVTADTVNKYFSAVLPTFDKIIDTLLLIPEQEELEKANDDLVKWLISDNNDGDASDYHRNLILQLYRDCVVQVGGIQEDGSAGKMA